MKKVIRARISILWFALACIACVGQASFKEAALRHVESLRLRGGYVGMDPLLRRQAVLADAEFACAMLETDAASCLCARGALPDWEARCSGWLR